MFKESCRLCIAVKENQEFSIKNIYNKKLLESENFIVIPALGPLKAGHVMIVDKQHQQNLLSASKTLWEEYEKLIHRIRSKFKIYNKNLLEAEHGGLENYNSGACINHTHINLLPSLGNLEIAFQDVLTITQSEKNFKNISNNDKPYLLIRGTSQIIKVFRGINLPSQFIRRLVAKHLNLDKWNWRASQNLELVKETIKIWDGTIKF